MNRPYKAKHYRELLNLAGLDPSNDPYKPLRPAEITSSEQHVWNVISVLEAEYLNPFDVGLGKNELYNLSSGIPLRKDVEDLLNIWDNGKVQANEFSEKRIFSKDTQFHQPVKRNKVPSFKSSENKITLKKDNKVRELDTNRNIIGKLLSLSIKANRLINLEEAFKYPLYTVPLCLAHRDGSMKKPWKSKLVECIIPDNNIQNEEIIDKHMSAYVLDMMAQIRSCINNVPETFEQFTEIFLSSIPKNFRRVDLVADTYPDVSIKSEERETHLQR